MALEKYYEKFYIQGETPSSDGFGGWIWNWSDAVEFDGLYIQNSSNEMQVAEAMGYRSAGTFAVNIKTPLEEGDIVRRVSDNTYIRITGLPLESPEIAASQIKRYSAAITQRPN